MGCEVRGAIIFIIVMINCCPTWLGNRENFWSWRVKSTFSGLFAMDFERHPRVTDPLGPPLHWKNRSKIRPRWQKYPKNSSPLESYTQLSSPLGSTLKFWDFWAVNNRIQNPHPRDFPSPLAFGSLILSPLTKQLSPGHWDRGVERISRRKTLGDF